ncbi:MAG: DUF1189 domain-containing protein [Lachnospiraceae bacterium]|nr:DUF1189 domain-containing protein [Lachnospiraceae bacterium]
MNVFEEIGAAIAKISAYAQFLKNKKGKVFGYGVLLVTIYFIIANVRGVIGVTDFMGNLEPMIRQNVPNFSLQNGKLSMEKPLDLNEDGLLVSIDSNADWVMSMTESEWRRALTDYDQVMIADKNGIVMKNNGKIQMSAWPTDLEFNREDLIGFLPYISVGIVIFYLFYYVGAVGVYFFAALFVALVCMIIASIQKYRFTFGQIYLMSIYGKTLSLLLKGVFRLAGVSGLPVIGSFLGLMYFIISCVYVCIAMSHIENERKQNEFAYNGAHGNNNGSDPYIY